MSEGGGAANTIETQDPARIDRLPWSSWHTLVIFALGVTWVLDGLEISSKRPALRRGWMWPRDV